MEKIITKLEELKRIINFEIDSHIKEIEVMHNYKQNLEKEPFSPTMDRARENLVSIKRLCDIFTSFKVGTIRLLIFNNEWGFNEDCVRRMGAKKILIDIKGFEAWIDKPKPLDQRYEYQRKKWLDNGKNKSSSNP